MDFEITHDRSRIGSRTHDNVISSTIVSTAVAARKPFGVLVMKRILFAVGTSRTLELLRSRGEAK
jgi:hypothetical protein